MRSLFFLLLTLIEIIAVAIAIFVGVVLIKSSWVVKSIIIWMGLVILGIAVYANWLGLEAK